MPCRESNLSHLVLTELHRSGHGLAERLIVYMSALLVVALLHVCIYVRLPVFVSEVPVF